MVQTFEDLAGDFLLAMGFKNTGTTRIFPTI